MAQTFASKLKYIVLELILLNFANYALIHNPLSDALVNYLRYCSYEMYNVNISRISGEPVFF